MTTLKLRLGQRHFLRLVDQYRTIAFVARRQYGKTTVFAAIALKKMMKRRNHTVIFGSAKINLSREIVRKEAHLLTTAIRDLTQNAESAGNMLAMYDAKEGKPIPIAATDDDYAEIFESQRLEFRLYHDRTSYSRTKVVALRADTVGETGDLMCDEVGRVRNWDEVWEAVEPIVASDPTFRLILATTPPPDDTHFSFPMLSPPIDAEFPVNPEGNLYISEMGIPVLRLSAFDAYEEGIAIYDTSTSEPLTPQEHFRRALDKDAWRRNYGAEFIVGGTAACGLIELHSAQQRGIGQTLFATIETDSDLTEALAWLIDHIPDQSFTCALGEDLATTEKEISNPTSLSVVFKIGADIIASLVLIWKTADDETALDRNRRVLQTLRDIGVRPRRLCVDATSERYFANRLRRELAALVPVELVISSEKAPHTSGPEADMNMKQYLGALITGILDDNRLTLPPDRYIKEDWRLVKRDRGTFVADVNSAGMHADTFDSVKLACHGLITSAGPIQAEVQTTKQVAPAQRMPWASRHYRAMKI